jgi:hypothetical protein
MHLGHTSFLGAPGVRISPIAVRLEVRIILQRHQSEYPRLDPPLTGFAIAFKEVQFLKALEYPVREFNLDSVWI